jgi:2'-5' RNA ligase
MRPHLFVAVVPPPAIREQLDEAMRPLRAEYPDLAWEAPSRWHVTLCFLGPVDPTPALLDEVAAVAHSTAPLPVQLSGGGAFGDHVLWAGVDAELAPVAEELARAAGRADFPLEEREFHPHLTLARRRRRRRRGVRLQPAAARLSALTAGPWTADEFVVLRSGRPDYERVASWPLTG